MCELDVFVGNYAIIDWEVYSLWLSGRSIAEAVTVFVRDNRVLITDHHVSQDIIVSDFEGCCFFISDRFLQVLNIRLHADQIAWSVNRLV